MRIRQAVSSDADAIARLTTELGYPADPEQILSRLEMLLRSDLYFIAVAEDASGAVGWVAAEQRLLLESGERAEIVGLVVSAGNRRAGIGTALVQAAEAWARSRGFAAINVRSNVLRDAAHEFYERLGYTRIKTQHAYRKTLGGDE